MKKALTEQELSRFRELFLECWDEAAEYDGRENTSQRRAYAFSILSGRLQFDFEDLDEYDREISDVES